MRIRNPFLRRPPSVYGDRIAFGCRACAGMADLCRCGLAELAWCSPCIPFYKRPVGLGRSALQGGSWNQDLRVMGTTQCGLLTDTVELRLSPPFCRADSAFLLAKILCCSGILAPQELCSICRYAELIGPETSTNPVFISELSCLYVLAKEITRQWFE